MESLVPASFQCFPWNGTGSSVGCCNLIFKRCTSEAQRVLHGGTSWRQRICPSITHHGHFLGASVLSSVQCEPFRYGCCVEKQTATPLLGRSLSDVWAGVEGNILRLAPIP